MSWILKVAQYLPAVRKPQKEQTLKEMLTWTFIILLLYYTLGSINVWGADSAAVAQALDRLATFQTILGAEIGSIITLGIGPIVTASIVLQMMVGSQLLPWDTNTQEGKEKFQGAQKLMAYTLTVIEAVGWVLSGNFGPVAGDPMLVFLLAGQITLGGWMIILMDDLVQKWGFGSGVGLFIAAGVSKAVYVSIISPLTSDGQFYTAVDGNPTGALFSFLTTTELSALIPIISTILVFSAVVYMQTMRVEVPLTFGNVRGFGQKWPLKFVYTSNMPVILIAALITNVQIVGSSLAGEDGCSILGCFDGGQATSGVVFMLQPPADVITQLITIGLETLSMFDIFHIIVFLSVYTLGSTMFSIFWVRTTGQDAKSVAEQISRTGMKVPGFRKDTRVIEKVLQRYIPGLAVLSGFFVGLLAGLAEMTRAAGGGTGILLTVMILYRMYEQLAQKHMEELHPAMRDFFQN